MFVALVCLLPSFVMTKRQCCSLLKVFFFDVLRKTPSTIHFYWVWTPQIWSQACVYTISGFHCIMDDLLIKVSARWTLYYVISVSTSCRFGVPRKTFVIHRLLGRFITSCTDVVHVIAIEVINCVHFISNSNGVNVIAELYPNWYLHY